MRVTNGTQADLMPTERNNKGDSERVETRSRLVAREIEQKEADSNFAGVPPLALVRYVISRAATRTKNGR